MWGKNIFKEIALRIIHIFDFQSDGFMKEIISLVPSFSPCHPKCQKCVRIYATDASLPHSEMVDVLKLVL